MNRITGKPTQKLPIPWFFRMALAMLLLAQARTALCESYDVDQLIRGIELNDKLVTSEHVVQKDTIARYKPDGGTIAIERVIEYKAKGGKFRLSQSFPGVEDFMQDPRVWSVDPRHPANSIQYFPVTRVWDGQQATTYVPLFKIAWIEKQPAAWPQADGNLTIPSTSHRPIEGKTLTELVTEARSVAEGKVSVTPAKLGERELWLLEIDRSAGRNLVRAYIDDTVGFRVRSLERYTGKRLWWRVDLDEFTKNAEGVWTARRVNAYQANDKGPFCYFATLVEQWNANVPIDDDAFKVTMAAGTNIQDRKRQLVYDLKENTGELNDAVASLLASPLQQNPSSDQQALETGQSNRAKPVVAAAMPREPQASTGIYRQARRVLIAILGISLLMLALNRIRRKGVSCN